MEALAEAGIGAVIQPGGSVRDDEVIEAANSHGLAMASPDDAISCTRGGKQVEERLVFE